MPASSLLVATGQPVPRLPLLAEVLGHLETGYETADQGQSPQAAWNERLIILGRPVQVLRPQLPPLSGMAEGTDERGQLHVRDENGRLHQVAAGDVRLRPG